MTFEVEPAPPDRAWVLDPGIEWATYLGGSVPSADPLSIPDAVHVR